jgi:hypothetical protein
MSHPVILVKNFFLTELFKMKLFLTHFKILLPFTKLFFNLKLKSKYIYIYIPGIYIFFFGVST